MMSVDDVWDRAEKRQEVHEADLHARIVKLDAELKRLRSRRGWCLVCEERHEVCGCPVLPDNPYHRAEQAEAERDTLREQATDLLAAVAGLEAENKSQVEKTIEARQETHLAIIQKRQAEAALAERDRMLDEWWKWSVAHHFTPSMGRVAWFARLRACAEEGSENE